MGGRASYAEKQKFVLEAASDLGLNADDVVQLALTRLRDAKQEVHMHFVALFPLLATWSLKPQECLPALQKAFVGHRGVQTVLGTIRSTFDKMNFDFRSPDASELTTNDAQTLSKGWMAVYSMLHCLPSWTVFKMAIRRDLIRLLAFSSTPCISSKLSPGRNRRQPAHPGQHDYKFIGCSTRILPRSEICREVQNF